MANKNVNVSFTLTPYKLNDCNFKLSDDRAAKSLNNFGVCDYTLTASESSKIADKIIKSSKLKLKESIAISEQNSKSIVFNKKESLSVVVTYWDNIKFVLRFVETFACTDKSSNSYALNKAENITITDHSNKEMGINLSESFNIDDDFIRKIKFIRLCLEKLKTVDCSAKSIVKNNSENIGFAERLFNLMTILKEESLKTTDSIKHKANFIRLFHENIATMERIAKNINITKKEDLSIEDVLIRACNAVLSNIGISVDGMTLAKFKDLILTPPSYDKFVDFNVGDYEYQKAMVRLLVESVAAQAEPLVFDMGIPVDIDDTNDRGSTQIVNKGSATKVYFNKFYYHAPEVNVTLNGGSIADGLIIPSIVSIGNIDTVDGKHANEFATAGFGLGGYSTGLTDLNIYKGGGLFAVNTNCANAPVNDYGFVIAVQSGTNKSLQIFSPLESSNANLRGTLFIRIGNASTWSAWKKLVDIGSDGKIASNFLPPHNTSLQRNTAYAVGDIAYNPPLPSWARLECVVAGKTSVRTEPVWGAVTAGQYVNDGNVKWIIDDVRDGLRVGEVKGSLYVPSGYVKANGATVNRTDYPRLFHLANRH